MCNSGSVYNSGPSPPKTDRLLTFDIATFGRHRSQAT
jgi:hypothetical protein